MNEAVSNSVLDKRAPDPDGKPARTRKWVIIAAVAGVLTVILVTVLYVVIWGLPVSGAPDPGDVESVSVKFGEEPGGAVEYTDGENIKTACGLLKDLNYKPFDEADQEDEVIVTIVFNMKDGTRKVAAANGTTCWWQGRAMALMQEGRFVETAQGAFPQDE